MPKIDVSAVAVRVGTGYPEPFNDACSGRTRKRLGDVDMMSANRDGRFVHKDGTPY